MDSRELSSVKTQFAEFEHAIHEADASGQILTADFMNKALRRSQ